MTYNRSFDAAFAALFGITPTTRGEQERLAALDVACHAEMMDPDLLRESRETFVECARPLNPVRIDTGD